MRAGGGGDRERAAGDRTDIHQEPRFRSEKSAADAKLEKTSLSAGGFLRVPDGYQCGLWLRYQRAWKQYRPAGFAAMFFYYGPILFYESVFNKFGVILILQKYKYSYYQHYFMIPGSKGLLTPTSFHKLNTSIACRSCSQSQLPYPTETRRKPPALSEVFSSLASAALFSERKRGFSWIGKLALAAPLTTSPQPAYIL